MSYAELAAASNFSFLRGASHPGTMVETAIALGYTGLALADRNSVAGVVRGWSALNDARAAGRGAAFKLVSGARLVFADATPDLIVHPRSRRGWGRLTRLLTLGNRRVEKGECQLFRADVLDAAGDWAMIVMPQARETMIDDWLAALRATGEPLWLGATMLRDGRDQRRLLIRDALARRHKIALLATQDALYAAPDARPLHDLLTCIRAHTQIDKAGTLLAANAERYLKPPAEIARLFAAAPHAIAATHELLATIDFDLGQLAYEYPHEPIPAGQTPQAWLETLVTTRAREKWPEGVPPKLQALLDEELPTIARLNYAPYFLTVHDIVAFAQQRGILCQGRGSAANSAVCFVLGITAVDPARYNLLFSRFISEERREPPDIDVDFEHERREEVMQYIYARYGRERAGIVATVIHYRPRSTVKDLGKALGLSEDVTSRLASTVWGSYARDVDKQRFAENGFDPDAPDIARLTRFAHELRNFPRHLSQHVGGFVLTEDRLDETVPIHNAAMPDRTFIEWDKDDIDALGLMKVDILALGMLTCIRKAFTMITDAGGPSYGLDSVPDADPRVYDMLCAGDSVGVFQVESRAQMNMLPRLRPREFYDLAIQVAIVRPGPIQGDMVHPYLRRRQGREAVDFPSPAPPHDPHELRGVLGKTLGVPLFQEQAMKLAITAASFTPGEANQLRRAMATFRNLGTIEAFRDKLVGGMVARGYDVEFAQRCFKQIEGFGSYGFPESHAIAFARLVWVSSWLKCHHPAIFAAALLNAQPMGFYAPAQIVRDAQQHGVIVDAADVNRSQWDNSAPAPDRLILGLRQIDGFRKIWAEAIATHQPFTGLEDLARRAALPPPALRLLADADALRALGHDRRQGSWDVRRMPPDELPLFAAARANELAQEPDSRLPAMALGEEVAADYQTLRLSLKAHPMAILRPHFAAENVVCCAALATAKSGTRLRVAGLVLIRQRPGNGKAIFVTLEDESGVANLILWERTFERYRRAVMAARLMLVEGELQKSPEGVLHLLTHRVIDRSADLAHLATPETPRAPPPLHAGHPRAVRSFPRSRDFH